MPAFAQMGEEQCGEALHMGIDAHDRGVPALGLFDQIFDFGRGFTISGPTNDQNISVRKHFRHP